MSHSDLKILFPSPLSACLSADGGMHIGSDWGISLNANHMQRVMALFIQVIFLSITFFEFRVLNSKFKKRNGYVDFVSC